MIILHNPNSLLADQVSTGTDLQRSQRVANWRARMVPMAIAAIGLFVAYELIQYALGACQGYAGTAAFERSLLAQYVGLWSVDPMTCR